MDIQSKHLISIILPTYNGAQYISRAIASVIAQSYQQWELIVVDDGSSDDTANIVQGFLSDQRIIYSKNERNLGIQKTLNKGLSISKGVYIARIDDDDVWSDTEKLQKQIEFFITHPDHVLVGTGVVIVDENDKELIRYLLPSDDLSIRSKILGKNCFVHSSVMFKKETAVHVGGYDESVSVLHMEDYDLWLKLGMHGKLANLPFYAVRFTLRDGGLSSKNKLHQARKAFFLARKYNHTYPGYFFAVIRSAVRFIVYGFILQFPVKIFVNRLAKWYKENW
ncbi:MAG: glycosyltransferase [Pseudomonadota bacterium]